MLFGKEPAMIIGLIAALLALAVGFGLKISGVQIDLIMVFVGSLVPVATAYLTRKQVYSEDTTKKLVQAATESPVGTSLAIVEAIVVKEEIAATKIEEAAKL